ncbi:uncharacterized protein ATC70_005244 [Mucor velutinosus]|uniref:BZIP domain-containing protein n=1 Tax=Mucor velutinosus TaxID=708070 RepID=A0AAN7DAC0_9FUNG|nr:hypothetical protein ATC70_005244 [Mucor velutinosus]
MFKDTNYQHASTATLTPTKLLMENPMQNSDWNFNQASINELNSYMNGVDTFNQPTNIFDQQFNQQSLMMPPSPEDNHIKMASPPSHDSQSTVSTLPANHIPLTPPSPTRDTLPKKQRKKLLEKNREAAYRCRQKKKKWVNSLEERSQSAEAKNRELSEQVSQLREESIYLRNLLLTHGNCECDVVQAYLRRTSEQLSHNAPPPPILSGMPTLVESSSSVSGSESSMSSMSKKTQQMYNDNPNASAFLYD